MSDVEVLLDWEGSQMPLGLLRRFPAAGHESLTFTYADSWLAFPGRFSIEPSLKVTAGAFALPPGRRMFGALGDSAPDTWGRALMQRRERLASLREGRKARWFQEVDYLLGVTDIARLGAMRFRKKGSLTFESPLEGGVPGYVALGALLVAADRVERGEDTEEDLRVIFAPGSSLGGARPKASVYDQAGRLAIAKFPKQSDVYSIERWEGIALALAAMAGITVSEHAMVDMGDRDVLLSYRFDRNAGHRIPFLSAMAMIGGRDGESGSYLELADQISENGATAKADRTELYRRLVFNVLISNLDDHMRNHGFLWTGAGGWTLSPAYDLNPVSQNERPRILVTHIDLEDGTCDLGLVLEVAGFFGLTKRAAVAVVCEVVRATRQWRAVAESRGAPAREIKFMESAFEHADLATAETLCGGLT